MTSRLPGLSRSRVLRIAAIMITAILAASAREAVLVASSRPDPEYLAVAALGTADPAGDVDLGVVAMSTAPQDVAATLRVGYQTPESFVVLLTTELLVVHEQQTRYQVRLPGSCGLRLVVTLTTTAASRQLSVVTPCAR